MTTGTMIAVNIGVVMMITMREARVENITPSHTRYVSGRRLSMMSMSLENLI